MKRAEFTLMILQVPIDALLLLLAGISAYTFRFSELVVGVKPVVFTLTFNEFMRLNLFVILIWLVVFMILGLYSSKPNRKFIRDLVSIFWGSLIGMSFVALIIVFTQEPFDSRFLIIFGWFFGFVFMVLGRIFSYILKFLMYRMGLGLRKVIIIGEGMIGEELERYYKSKPSSGVEVVRRFTTFVNENIEDLSKYQIDEIIYTDIKNTKLTISLIEYCNEKHIVFKYSADLLGTYFSNVSIYPVAGIPLAELKRTPLEGWVSLLKRLFDIVMSLIMLLVTCPLVIITIFIISIETGAPIIYRNERVGVHGKRFQLYKFRSMYKEESTGDQFGDSGARALEREAELIKNNNTRVGPIYKIENDPRVTPFGRFIRRWSIDELPQFLNVLVGNMSIVGPRPHQPREVEKYEKNDRKVFAIKPGITGLAQISGRSDLSFEEEMRLDTLYLKNWNILTDFIICLKTPFVLFNKRKVE